MLASRIGEGNKSGAVDGGDSIKRSKIDGLAVADGGVGTGVTDDTLDSTARGGVTTGWGAGVIVVEG